MTKAINYGQLMHKAMRGLMAEVLTQVAREGLPGGHHFFITFDTTHPGVDMVADPEGALPEGDDHRPPGLVRRPRGDEGPLHRHPELRRRPRADRGAVRGDQDLRRSLVEFGLRFDAHEDRDGAEPATPEPPTRSHAAEADGGRGRQPDKFRKH